MCEIISHINLSWSLYHQLYHIIINHFCVLKNMLLKTTDIDWKYYWFLWARAIEHKTWTFNRHVYELNWDMGYQSYCFVFIWRTFNIWKLVEKFNFRLWRWKWIFQHWYITESVLFNDLLLYIIKSLCLWYDSFVRLKLLLFPRVIKA